MSSLAGFETILSNHDGRSSKAQISLRLEILVVA